MLPGPLGPEGVLAIPDRNLLIVSGEEDDPTFGVRSTMMIYELKGGKPTYPQIQSGNDANGLPIPWSALSGMDPERPIWTEAESAKSAQVFCPKALIEMLRGS